MCLKSILNNANKTYQNESILLNVCQPLFAYDWWMISRQDRGDILLSRILHNHEFRDDEDDGLEISHI